MQIAIKALLLILMSFTCKAADTFTYKIQASVFHDLNSNGFKEGDELPVGGVRFTFSSGEEIRSDAMGNFNLEIKTWQTNVRIQLDEDSLPAGAMMTSPSTVFLSSTTGMVQQVSFAMHFPEKVVQLNQLGVKAEKPNAISHQQGLLVQKVQEQFLIQGDIWQKYQAAQVQDQTQKISFTYELSPFRADFSSLEKFFHRPYSKVKKIEMQIGLTENQKAAQRLLNELKLKLKEKKYIGPEPVLLMQAGASAILIELESLDGACAVAVGSEKRLIKDGETLQIPLEQAGEGEILCQNKRGEFVFDRLVPLSEHYLSQPENNYVRLYMPQYLDEGSASVNHFHGFTDLSELEVNGQKLELKKGHFFYNKEASRGYNELAFKSGEKKFSFEYPLYYGHKFSFQTRLQALWKTSRTNAYNTSYSLPGLTQMALDMDYYWHPSWGIQANYVEDVIATTTENIDRTTSTAKHSRYSAHAMWRFTTQAKQFRTPELSLGLGWGGQSYNPGPLSKIRYMDDFYGMHARFQSLFSEVSAQSLDIMLTADAQLTSDVKGGQAVLLGSEFRIWLNEKFGKWFGIDPYYNRYYRYGSVQHMKLTLGVMAEVARSRTANSQDSFSEDVSAWTYVGFLWPFY